MLSRQDVDRALVHWGDRIFYPPNRIVRRELAPRLHVTTQQRASVIRNHIHATVVRRAPQAFMKITGGGRGMRAIASHLRYISRDGTLDIEDERGELRRGKEAVRDLLDQWRFSGALIGATASRREAYFLVLSTPAGTDPDALLKAARDLANAQLKDHLHLMVLHLDTRNPHVHLAVRAVSMGGEHLTARAWTEREHWRAQFAENLRSLGVDVEATRQTARGEHRTADAMWQVKARAGGTLLKPAAAEKSGERNLRNRAAGMENWYHVMATLAASELSDDRQLARQVAEFIRSSAFYREMAGRERDAPALSRAPNPQMHTRRDVVRSEPDLTR